MLPHSTQKGRNPEHWHHRVLGRAWGNRSSIPTGGRVRRAVTWEDSLAVSYHAMQQLLLLFTQRSWKLISTQKPARGCYSSRMHNCQNLEETKTSFTRWWINKQQCAWTVGRYRVIKRKELSSHEKTRWNPKCILPRKRSQSEKTTIVYDSNYMPFWKRQTYGESEKMSGCRGGRRGTMRWSTKHREGSQTLCVTL